MPCSPSTVAHPHPPLQSDLRRAVEEKVTALHLLASAERKLVEAQADESGALLLFLQNQCLVRC